MTSFRATFDGKLTDRPMPKGIAVSYDRNAGVTFMTFPAKNRAEAMKIASKYGEPVRVERIG